MSESPDLSPRSSASPAPANGNERKRKIKDDEDAVEKDTTESKASSKRLKRQKFKEKKNAKAAANPDIDAVTGLNTAIGRMNASHLADYIVKQTKKFQPELSVVELEDRRVPEHAFLDTSAWRRPRTLDNISLFLEKYSVRNKGSLQHTPTENKGEPHTLVICSAGLRAADVTRELRVFQTKSSTVAKLFAKHIKIKEAVESAKNTRMGIGVGTPRRLLDLIEAGAVSLASIQRILIDASHINIKKQGILDMPELQTPLTQLLSREDLRTRYDAGDVKIIVF